MSLVLCQLPKAGLGNQLFSLMKAYTFGHLNNLPVVVTGYNRYSIGPYLRREKSKRNYRGYFTFQKGPVGELLDKWKLRKARNYTLVREPLLEKIDLNSRAGKLFVYNSIPHWDDYFQELKNYRQQVIALLEKILVQSIRQELSKPAAPCIGVHVRMGDFRKLKPGEDFSKAGSMRTPEQYFIEIIETIREIHGTRLPVTVFTDGYRHEFEKLFAIGNISMAEGNPDIVDLLLLSKSRIIVASANSTFSYWAGFLGNAPLILHPGHIHESIRPADVNGQWYEGPLFKDQAPGLLRSNIKSINL